ncbi:nitroreductase family protein [Candidatus Riflebacteria bacterium]
MTTKSYFQPEQFVEFIKSRRSIRSFQEKEVSDEQINKLLHAARWAPSNNNRQGWYYIFVRDESVKLSMADAVKGTLEQCGQLPEVVGQKYFVEYVQNFLVFQNAPLVLVSMFSRPASISSKIIKAVDANEYASGEIFSLGMGIMNILLMASSMGLGSCVLTGPLLAELALKKILKVPGRYNLGPLVALGWPAEAPKPPRRKDLNLIHRVL